MLKINKLPNSWSIDGWVEMIVATVETALAKSLGEGERLNVLFNFSNTGDVRVGGCGSKCSGSPET